MVMVTTREKSDTSEPRTPQSLPPRVNFEGLQAVSVSQSQLQQCADN
jgi:hypothetical protein